MRELQRENDVREQSLRKCVVMREQRRVRMRRESKVREMRPYARRAARLNVKRVKKQRKCDRMRELRRVTML